jgi:hypothetical protein
MSVIRRVSGLARSGKLAWLVCFISAFSFVSAADSADKPEAATALLQQMTGTWQVQARMWPGAGAAAIDLPPAVAHRELVGGTFLQEVMQPAGKTQQAPFTRIAYFNYNTIDRQYEYFSLDTRLPQMMSYAVPGANRTRAGNVELAGSSFVAPEWGGKKNVPFLYRLSVGPVQGDKQVVRLFLTEQDGQGGEFVAFEYVYSR